ncbi:hypothetical protein [Mesorhizobium sp.]|uniref:hypothetical protein n=1 Tax=Mesorhizobium sp. TaxID=1871066 RepID=UPI002579E409|nr:hypothetical protein [Mesorhizobium sp.]
MPEKIGDLVDRPSLLDELGGKTVAQEMRTCDSPEFNPAMSRRFRTILETGDAHLNAATGGVKDRNRYGLSTFGRARRT